MEQIQDIKDPQYIALSAIYCGFIFISISFNPHIEIKYHFLAFLNNSNNSGKFVPILPIFDSSV